MKEIESWDLVIKPKTSFFRLNFSEVWSYRDLIVLFVKRDIVSLYNQTILGPFWFLFQTIASTGTFTFIFREIAHIPTDGLPAPLFYLSGLTIWNFFTACLNKNSNIFVSNASIFGKVYFPRLTVPIANIISSIFTFSIQLLLLIICIIFYKFAGVSFDIHFELLLLLPFLLILVSLLGLSIGLVFSSLTTKYRDMSFVLGFGIQLLMYCSPIIFPLDYFSPKIKTIILLNPISSYVELFKYIWIGHGQLIPWAILYSILFTIVLFIVGTMLFNRIERSFMDTV